MEWLKPGSVSYCTEKNCAEVQPPWQSLLHSRKLMDAFVIDVVFVSENE
jgi:hypothetical protein